MSYIAFLLTCLLTFCTALAAEKSTKAKKVEPTPVTSAPKTVIAPWEPTAYVENIDHLPAGYTGLDPYRFLEMFKSKVKD